MTPVAMMAGLAPVFTTVTFAVFAVTAVAAAQVRRQVLAWAWR